MTTVRIKNIVILNIQGCIDRIQGQDCYHPPEFYESQLHILNFWTALADKLGINWPYEINLEDHHGNKS